MLEVKSNVMTVNNVTIFKKCYFEKTTFVFVLNNIIQNVEDIMHIVNSTMFKNLTYVILFKINFHSSTNRH